MQTIESKHAEIKELQNRIKVHEQFTTKALEVL